VRFGIGLFAIIIAGALIKFGIGYLARGQELTPLGGGFTIVTPAKLVEGTESVDVQKVGKIDFHEFRGRKDTTDYLVGYLDYPQGFVSQSNPKDILEQMVNGVINSANGKLVSESMNFAGGPQQDIVASIQKNGVGFIQREHLALVGNRLYRVSLIAPEKTNAAFSSESDSFLHSLKVLAR